MSRAFYLVLVTLACLPLVSCGGPPPLRGVCIGAFLLADKQLDGSNAGGVEEWAKDARDLIVVSREYAAASGEDVFSRLANDLEPGVEVLEASQDQAAVSLAMPMLAPVMNGYLSVCEPFADDFYGGS